MNRHQKEIFIRGIFVFFAFASVLILALIVMFLFREGLPIFKEVLSNFKTVGKGF